VRTARLEEQRDLASNAHELRRGFAEYGGLLLGCGPNSIIVRRSGGSLKSSMAAISC
jgi:hypothetical protein